MVVIPLAEILYDNNTRYSYLRFSGNAAKSNTMEIVVPETDESNRT